MITAKKERLGYSNEITRYLDKYLIKDREWLKTYIYKVPSGNTWFIRVPGATTGNFKVDKDKITEINLNEEICFNTFNYYDREVLKQLNQFIGKRILFK